MHPPRPTLRPRALTLDLDDTLWPVGPAIAGAEAALEDWLRRHAPRAAARFGPTALRALRAAVAHELPALAHDLSALRRETIRRMLQASGHDEALVEPAFDAFFAARQRVEPYPDALPALERLARHWPLFALSNGNADLVRTGVAQWFVGGLNAQQVGVGKPDARMFHAACERLGVAPRELLHVGDDLRLDVHGALDAGLQAAWIDRSASDAAGPSDSSPWWKAADLTGLADLLGA